MTIELVLRKIDELKDDIDRRLDDISRRIDKFEDQNLSNREAITRLEERVRSTQSELCEHKADDKAYGVEFDKRLKSVEKAENKIWLYLGIIVASMAGGGGLMKLLEVVK